MSKLPLKEKKLINVPLPIQYYVSGSPVWSQTWYVARDDRELLISGGLYHHAQFMCC